MLTGILSLVMDVFVMAALGGAIYYTLRLSRSLDNFKASRDELKALVTDLSKNIDEAQRAIEGLKKTSNVAADNLDGVLHEARKMASEMKFINETSEGLAGRLEKLAERNRQIAEGLNPVSAAASAYAPDPDFPARPHRAAASASVDMPSFFIHDRDFDEGQEPSAPFGGDDDEGQPGAFASQAEKDLYEALQRNRKSSGGGRA